MDDQQQVPVTLTRAEWRRVVYAFEKQYTAEDGTPPPVEWFWTIAGALRTAAGTDAANPRAEGAAFP